MAEGPCRPRRWPRVNLVGMEAHVVRAQGVSLVGKGGTGVGPEHPALSLPRRDARGRRSPPAWTLRPKLPSVGH